jgi:hypothetical protein
MNHDPNTLVAVVQSALLELLELTEKVAAQNSHESKETFRDEAEKTILMFMAAIVLASREYTPGAHSFLSLLVNWQDKPGGEARYLNEYAARWQVAHKVIPQFFAAAVQHDLVHNTNIGRAMLCQIQLIGNNTRAADRNAYGARRDVVRDYLVLLEDFCETQQARGSTPDHFTSSVSSPAPAAAPHEEIEPSQRDEVRHSEVGGSIAFLGLTNWWLAEFSDVERAFIVSSYSDSEAKSLAGGTVEPAARMGYGQVAHSSGLHFYLGSSADLLMKMTDRLDGKLNYALSVKIVKKLVENLETDKADLVDRHHAYGWMAKRFFKERKFDQYAMQRTVWACVKQIEVAPKVRQLTRTTAFLKTEDNRRLFRQATESGRSFEEICEEQGVFVTNSPGRDIQTWHEGYCRLAVLLEKEKKYREVVALCNQALHEGWVGTDWNAKLLKCNIYAAEEKRSDNFLPDLPELRWDEDLIRETKAPPVRTVEAIPRPCPIPRFELGFTDGVLDEMNSEQRAFYRHLKESIQANSFPPVHGQSAYLNFYIRDNFPSLDNQTLERLYAELSRLGEPYKNEIGIYWRPVEWSLDCLLALEEYDKFFDETRPANIFSIRTYFANLKCNVRYFLGLPASGIDLLQMYDTRITKTTRKHPQEFERFVDAVFAEREQAHGSWFEGILAGSDRKDYGVHLFPMLHFARKSKIPNYCFYHCSKDVQNRIGDAFREAENRLRQHLGEKNVGEQWSDETDLFYAIKRAFPQFQVIHHGRPEWLGQMHFDVWLPELKIAIEYHGPQHFEAMEHYGGAGALEATKKRDELKRAACKRMDVQMFEVNHPDQISTLIDELARIAQANRG